jgi:tetratricopeptide (TPR) repeat protein
LAATVLLALLLLASTPARASAERWLQTLPGAEAQAAESARAGRFAEAIALATPLLEAEPERRLARIVRALAFYQTGEPTRALADVDYYLDREDDGTGRTLRALLRLELGQYAGAADDAAAAVAWPGLGAESRGAALIVLGRVQTARGQVDDAATAFRQVVALPDPQNQQSGHMGLELLAALPATDSASPDAVDVGSGFQRLALPASSVRYQADDGITAAAAARLGELLATRLGAVVTLAATPPPAATELVLYKSQLELDRQLGTAYRGPRTFNAVLRRVPGGTWTQELHIALNNPMFLFLLTHESVHLAQAAAGGDEVFRAVFSSVDEGAGSLPLWLMEGQADYLADLTLRDIAPVTAAFAVAERSAAVAQAGLAGRLLPLSALETAGGWRLAAAGNFNLAYGQAYFAAAFLAERYGVGVTTTLLEAQRAGQSFDTALQSVVGPTREALYADVLDYTRRRVGL